jgi:hypothetical protein
MTENAAKDQYVSTRNRKIKQANIRIYFSVTQLCYIRLKKNIILRRKVLC